MLLQSHFELQHPAESLGVIVTVRAWALLPWRQVGAEDRQGAKDAYFAHVAAFNGKIEELARQHERDAEQVAQRRRRVNAHAEVRLPWLSAVFMYEGNTFHSVTIV